MGYLYVKISTGHMALFFFLFFNWFIKAVENFYETKYPTSFVNLANYFKNKDIFSNSPKLQSWQVNTKSR